MGQWDGKFSKSVCNHILTKDSFHRGYLSLQRRCGEVRRTPLQWRVAIVPWPRGPVGSRPRFQIRSVVGGD